MLGSPVHAERSDAPRSAERAACDGVAEGEAGCESNHEANPACLALARRAKAGRPDLTGLKAFRQKRKAFFLLTTNLQSQALEVRFKLAGEATGSANAESVVVRAPPAQDQ